MTGISPASSLPPVARLVPGADRVDAPGLPGLRIDGDVRRISAGGAAGDGLAFGEGGRIAWESDRLLGPSGSLLLDFAYPADSYQIDRPVIRIVDPHGSEVLAVTIGRVLFKIRRPPHVFSIDPCLNEREGNWMRTVLACDRLADEQA